MNKIKNLIKKYPYYSAGAIAALLAIVGFVVVFNSKDAEEVAKEATRQVATMSVTEGAEGALGVAYPTASGNSFVVRAEASGRVERAVKVGTKVTAGTIIAELDNSSERAALTQAQGYYEAAQAGAAQSDVSVDDAKTALAAAKQNAVSASRVAMTAWNNVLFNTVDELFSSPRISPGVRISASSQATELSRNRLEFNTVLSDWQKDLASLSNTSDIGTINAALDRATADVDALTRMVDSFISLLPKHQPDTVFTTSELTRLSAEFATARTTLDTQHSALSGAKSALARADEAVNSASIGGTGGAVSSANAAIKQALGSYQAAKANYDRTIVRAPFAGTITSQNVTVGDILNVGADVAIIVPEEGVETKRWWTLPLSAVKYMPDNAFVFIVNNDNVIEEIKVETGLVTASNIKVTGLNGSENVIKDVRGLKAGERVEVAN
ncbi:hypothetical protein A2392_01660 [Candidatus Kaiserbacteria bacterium RIFOXYB1_FULL_46_14]|uniref:Membrane fusion protein biotin-lipoyl like domain-containing protein n=1 Tax=Candidatus Kaiserbacteria bacterium RIFOXYB1_FULL_46_14 TaxID=1798531 RepID=A0A1F6FJW1_9BACT|nr:MAG: hypothetical protein A2392_01660 [Candidatus Kaiserbacteria bacterium RIFOXYB1_FULL_46_14]